MTIATYDFDAVVVGAGGAGLRAAYELGQAGLNIAVVTKVFPTRSHTVSAQGGMAAALGNVHKDDWRWHMYDTVKGSDYIGDQDSIEYMCEMAPQAMYELDHMGMPFSRLDNGRIYQRAFGGQTMNYGEKIAQRTCAAADRTGHALLHTLYQQNVRVNTNFYNEWYAVDLVKAQNGAIAGVIAISIESGETAFFRSKTTILATGGAGRIYESTTNAFINTGDGVGMALRANVPVQDMEFWQFHPTGIAGAGVLVTEGCRGEGGFLINKNGERFMERYAPNAKDLASRDVVSRAISLELREGNGYNPEGVDYVKLDLTHLGEDIINKRLPGIRELSMTFAHVDPIKAPIPVVPTCHYMMGGVPTNVHGQAITQDGKGQDHIIPGLYAIGECACVSVHGANRLGSNSLLDLVVFGRASGKHIAENINDFALEDISESDLEQALSRMNRWNEAKTGESFQVIRHEMKRVMQQDFGVFRQEQALRDGLKKLEELSERLKTAKMDDHSQSFNTTRIEALELDNLMNTALATAHSAVVRTESRGAHSREDYPERDDENWLKHTLYFSGDHKISYREVNRKPNKVDAFPPKPRVY
ncbi:succinate dehydrogenase flavoprotein subunit [Piscirickettsia salmonis]|uniref:succinate dehydrogenase flavoprotein subunit n=1 Tax=Piscirickettsia salmonis TaxID=1238 RepID=UPI0007C95E69|nr:Succinate dehydrogenase flavoprotein subunit [Piscirickettsiaceae bacterium NZ-RLO1]